MTRPKESVWDYPRPPRIEAVTELIRVAWNDAELALSNRAKRVQETSNPPTYYVPPDDVLMENLVRSTKTSFCEWKGQAIDFDAVVGDVRIQDAAWSYPNPSPAFRSIADHVAFYPSKMSRCAVGEEFVSAQPGDFYGGWITSNLVGTFKGTKMKKGW